MSQILQNRGVGIECVVEIRVIGKRRNAKQGVYVKGTMISSNRDDEALI